MSLKNLDQYRKLAFFLYKYGSSDLVKNSGLSYVLDEDMENKNQDVKPTEMVEDLKNMGPAFIKLGQLLSTRPDILPKDYIDALSELQDGVEPFSYKEVSEIIENELKIRISKAFNVFEEEPLASASLGQAHLAELPDGKKVVVKIQRPGIRERIAKELEVLENMAGFLVKNTQLGKQFGIDSLMLQFKKTLLRELNYLKEAENMIRLQNNLVSFPSLLIPTPISDYTTDKVLTMEYLKGRKITSISPLTKIELNGEQLADDLFHAYLKQIAIDGFMHADPHPGNIHITDDNRIALLDVGMVAFISEYYREKYLQFLFYLGDGKADKIASLLMGMSTKMPVCNEENFKAEIRDLVQENQNMTVQNLQTGKLIFAIIRTAAHNGFLLPPELSLVGKALLNLDQVGRTIAPDFRPADAIHRHAISLMRKHMIKDLTSYNLFSTLLESKKFIEMLPERMNTILERAANNKISLKVDAFDEKHLMRGFQKVANRITLGLILAALLIASAMLMQVPASFSILGYPGLGILSFLMAAIGAIIMAIQIFMSDE